MHVNVHRLATVEDHKLFVFGGYLHDVDDIQVKRIHLCLSESGVSQLPMLTVPHRASICSALTQQMHTALVHKSLGRWAELLQKRMEVLPYSDHKSMHEVRRLGCVYHWHVGFTPPGHLIYAVFHVYMSILYIGQTHLAPAQTYDSSTGTDTAILHKSMSYNDEADWGICVIRYVRDPWWAAVKERDLWWRFRRWVVNDVAPGIPQTGPVPSNRGWLNLKVFRLLKDLRAT